MRCDNMDTVSGIKYAKLKFENRYTSTSIKQVIPGTIGIYAYSPMYNSYIMYSEVLGFYLTADYPGTLEWKSNTRAGLSRSLPINVKSRVVSACTLKDRLNGLMPQVQS